MTTTKKYEFTGETKTWGLTTLHRIRRLSDGMLGGWVESEGNLSHDGDCWVCDDAQVYGRALVCDAAQVYDDAHVYGQAQVCDAARVYGRARIYGRAQVCDDAQIYRHAQIYGQAQVGGHARIRDATQVSGAAIVTE